MNRIFGIILLSLTLVGCASFQKAYDVATNVSVSPTAVIVAGNAFDALERTAANYLRLPRCPKARICSDVNAVVPIKKAVRSGRAARNQLEQFLATHPGQLGPSGLYDALIAANNTLQDIFYVYNVGATP